VVEITRLTDGLGQISHRSRHRPFDAEAVLLGNASGRSLSLRRPLTQFHSQPCEGGR
jgi:hypothetical protein